MHTFVKILILVGLIVGAGFAVFLAYNDFSQLDNEFSYNAKGYITNTDDCHQTSTGNAEFEIEGYISISFYFVENPDEIINLTSTPPGVCADFWTICCSGWKGDLVFFQIYYNETGSYIIADASNSLVQNYNQLIAGGIIFSLVAIGCLAPIVVYIIKKINQRGYKQIPMENQ